MIAIHIKGHVTEQGELVFDAPKNLPPGEVDITIQAVTSEQNEELIESEIPTPDDLKDLLNFTPKTGKEIVEMGLMGGWEHKGITDSVEWVEEQRKKRREHRKWRRE
jgi:hypothetical protein